MKQRASRKKWELACYVFAQSYRLCPGWRAHRFLLSLLSERQTHKRSLMTPLRLDYRVRVSRRQGPGHELTTPRKETEQSHRAQERLGHLGPSSGGTTHARLRVRADSR